jgi:hypothetical protein
LYVLFYTTLHSFEIGEDEQRAHRSINELKHSKYLPSSGSLSKTPSNSKQLFSPFHHRLRPHPLLLPSRQSTACLPLPSPPMATVARTLVAACPARSLLRLRSRRLPSSSSIRPARQRAGVGSVRCMARRPDSSYSPLRSGQGGDRAPTEMAPLFPGCDYEHWLIVMDKPGGEGATKQQMIDCYIQTLAQVLGR